MTETIPIAADHAGFELKEKLKAELEKAGVAAVYTPKDFELNRIMSDVVRIVERTKDANKI